MNNNIKIDDLIKIKADVICNGIKHNDLSDKIYKLQHKTEIKRTSNMGLQLLFNEDIIVSIPYRKKTKSKYYLYEENNKLYLSNDIIKIEIKPYPNKSPDWYDYKLTNGKPIFDYIQKEGKNVLICSVTESCCYFSKGEQCAFCALNGLNKYNEKNRINIIIEAFKYILEKDNTVESINLTGGNLYSKDKGALQYINILKEIRCISNIPVAIEISPPDDLNVLEELHKAGATAIEFNVEIWDEEIRKELMPGKAKIKKEHYIEAWKKAVKVFGIGNVGSGIIIGLEPKEYSLEGIKEMIEIGCLPSILPFKPTEGSNLENHKSCSLEDILYVSEESVKILKKKKLSPINGPGCIGCGACTLEGDFYKFGIN